MPSCQWSQKQHLPSWQNGWLHCTKCGICPYSCDFRLMWQPLWVLAAVQLSSDSGNYFFINVIWLPDSLQIEYEKRETLELACFLSLWGWFWKNFLRKRVFVKLMMEKENLTKHSPLGNLQRGCTILYKMWKIQCGWGVVWKFIFNSPLQILSVVVQMWIAQLIC